MSKKIGNLVLKEYFDGIRKDGMQTVDSISGVEYVQCDKSAMIICLSDGVDLSSINQLFKNGTILHGGSKWGCKEAEAADFYFEIVMVDEASHQCLRLQGDFVSEWATFEAVNITIYAESEELSSGKERRDFSPIDGTVTNQAFSFASIITADDANLFNGALKIISTLTSSITFRWELSAVTKQCPYSYLYCPPTTHCCGWNRWCCHKKWYGCTGHCTACSAQCADACYMTTASPGNPCGTSITHSQMWLEQSQIFSFNLNVTAELPLNTSSVQSFTMSPQVVWSLPVSFSGISGTWVLSQSVDVEVYVNGSKPLKTHGTAFSIARTDMIGFDYKDNIFTPIAQASQASFQDRREKALPEPSAESSVGVLLHPVFELKLQNGLFCWDNVYNQAFAFQVAACASAPY